MNRRKLLQGIAATVAQFAAWRLPIKTAARDLRTRRLRPTDPGWPSASSWEQLKKAVGGNLVPVRSLFGACSTNPEGDPCVDATKISHFISFYAANLLNPHWGEQVAVGGDNTLSLSMVCQGLSKEEIKQVWQPFFDWVSASPSDFSANRLRTGAGKARGWWDVPHNDSMVQDRRLGAATHHGWWRGDQDQVGAFIHGYDSMWLPAALLKPHKQSLLANALYLASRHKRVQLHFNKGLAGASAETIAAAKNTTTNPAVCEAFCLAIIADGERPAYPGLSRPAIDFGEARNDARKIDLAAHELRRIAPGAGSYVSESNFFNASWQRAYWGKNYPRLQAVKKKYDPDGLFFVYHGVGSEQWGPDGFSRL